MTNKEEPPKKKQRGKKVLAAGLLVVLLGGGGVGAALYASNAGLLFGGGHKAAEPERPKLVPRNGISDAEAARFFSSTGDKRPDPAKFQASYYPLAENFTANLGGGEGYVQIGLGVSTYYDEQVFENVKLHEMAVRSAVLLALTEQDSAALSTQKGKEGLKASLRNSINQVLKSKEGFGGIDDVYFTSFVIQ